jgi:hypothetical protein
MLFEALDSVDRVASQLALKSTHQSAFILSQSFEKQTLEIFSNFIYPMVYRIQRLRRAAYTLAHLGELEAIGQATQRQTKQTGHEFKDRIRNRDFAKTLTDEKLDERVWAGLMKIRDKILQAFRLALVQEQRPEEIIETVKNSYPKIKNFKRPPRELKPLREADSNPKDKKEFIFDFVNQEDWDLAVSAYKDTQLPENRFDDGAEYDSDVGYARYQWEVEQDITDDFVKQVRDGQVDAANDLGIKDFVWVAILDNKTDDCCANRVGMTTREIEEALASGKLDKIECDAVVPPAHPNCRCSLGPIASTDPVQGPDWKTFNEWLNS